VRAVAISRPGSCDARFSPNAPSSPWRSTTAALSERGDNCAGPDVRRGVAASAWAEHAIVSRRPITTEAIGSAATHPSLRGVLATKQSRGHNMRGASNPDGRTVAPGLLRFARNDGQGIGSLVSACRLSN
jgi:hypothetical protein